jgi:hypothetical protein
METNTPNPPETPGPVATRRDGFRALLPALLWAITLLAAVVWFSWFENVLPWWAGWSVVLGLVMGAVFGGYRGSIGKASLYAVISALFLSSVLFTMFFSDEPFDFDWRNFDFSDPRWVRLETFRLLTAGLVGAVSGAAVGAGLPCTLQWAAGMGSLCGALSAGVGTAVAAVAHIASQQHGLAVHAHMVNFPGFLLLGAVAGALIGVLCQLLDTISVKFSRLVLRKE